METGNFLFATKRGRFFKEGDYSGETNLQRLEAIILKSCLKRGGGGQGGRLFEGQLLFEEIR